MGLFVGEYSILVLDNEADFVHAVQQTAALEIVGYFILVDDEGEAQAHGMG